VPTNETAQAGTQAADNESTERSESTPVGAGALAESGKLPGGATLPEADLLVERYHGRRVRIDCGDHLLEGVLRRGVRRPKDGGIPRFVVYGRASNWRLDAEQFKADPAIYRRALRSYAQPTEHYVPFSWADRIELVEVVA
jgi:hypothetical protein